MVFVGGAPLAQRCLSDPGANRLTVFNEKGFREQCLGESTYAHARKVHKEKHLALLIVNKTLQYIS